MKKWAYHVAYVRVSEDFHFSMQVGNSIYMDTQVWAQLNYLGQQGWELVNVVERIGDLPFSGSGVQKAGAVFGAMVMGQPTSTVQSTNYRPATLGYFYHFKKDTSADD